MPRRPLVVVQPGNWRWISPMWRSNCHLAMNFCDTADASEIPRPTTWDGSKTLYVYTYNGIQLPYQLVHVFFSYENSHRSQILAALVTNETHGQFLPVPPSSPFHLRKRHKDKGTGREVLTDIFVAWGHQQEKDSPLTVDEIADYFDKSLDFWGKGITELVRLEKGCQELHDLFLIFVGKWRVWFPAKYFWVLVWRQLSVKWCQGSLSAWGDVERELVWNYGRWLKFG